MKKRILNKKILIIYYSMSHFSRCFDECSKIERPNVNKKLTRLIIVLFCLLCIIVTLGVIGYKFLFKMSYVDAIYNTAITTSTLGIAPGDKTDAEKIFTGIYAVLVGVFFISVISAIVSYMFTTYILD
ncbi:putative potassium channel protein [Hirudovirus strain Sangsue]|nr:putative potassium channel protein [Hirudovirus strain Sangsue]